jgi:hypothetical protein
MSFLWVLLGVILGVNIGFRHARSRARMIRRGLPRTFHYLHSAKFLQSYTTPICR